MASWNAMDGETVRAIKLLNALGNPPDKIADAVRRSKSTISRVLDEQYNDDGQYIGSQKGWERKASQTPPDPADTTVQREDWEWLKDVMVKVLYDACQTNHLLKQLIEKWK